MSGTIKRVISHPDEIMGQKDGKMSKKSGEMTPAEADVACDFFPAIGREPSPSKKIASTLVQSIEQSAAIENAATAAVEQISLASDDGDDGELNADDDIPDPGAPVTCITKPISTTSTTSSSLSDDRSAVLVDGKVASGAASAGHMEVSSSALPSEDHAETSPITRSVSKDSGASAKSDASESSASSTSSGRTGTTNGTPAGHSGSGNWGWFEDVHGHETPGTPIETKKALDGEQDSESPKKKGHKKKKKGGLLQFGSADLSERPFHPIIDPNREAASMAVTAPTYVLEESISSQKLWKDTAGNRPPQPVEERAFFEKMWAQNFARSQVKYELPVEVLTASSPISLSPFADGNFGDDGAGGAGAELSNYNLAAPFNANVSHRIGAGKGTDGDSNGIDAGADPAIVKAAEADAAEATLIHRMNGAGAVGMYFDPNRPKDYNLKSLGPHHHHHTLVNKKVKGAGSDDNLTVLVRGDNVFGTTVSKSFPRDSSKGDTNTGIDTVSISIANYRVVESKKHGKYAQFLVIFCEGNFRDTVGVWKRYSDFAELSRKVAYGHESCSSVFTGMNPLSVTEDPDVELLPNALTSWRLLKKRQRWYRCLDAGYLSLKVFLLERFLHDILFESSNPQILRDFIGVNTEGR